MARVEQHAVDLTSEITDHVITKADRNRNHDRLRETSVPIEGIFGPGSMLWKMLEPLPMLPHMLTLAGLIEGAVPKIWFGTAGSVTHFDYISRYARSYDAFMTWFVDDVDAALKMSRKINGYHSMIGGTAPHDSGDVKAGQAYRAAEEQLMVLTVATQVFPIKDLYERVVRPLTAAERAQYYEECRRFASLFGVDASAMPADWDAFEARWNDVFRTGEMELGKTGHERYGPLLDQSGYPLVARVLMRWMVAVEFNLMPESLRRQFEQITPLAKRRPLLTEATMLALAAAVRVLPSGLLGAPRVRAARRRVGVLGPPGRAESWLVRRLRHPYGAALPTLTTPASPEADPRNSRSFTLPPV